MTQSSLAHRNVLKRYQHGEISLGKMAELLGITTWDAIDLLKKEKIAVPYGEADLREDLAVL